jgi:hypothetical protein
LINIYPRHNKNGDLLSNSTVGLRKLKTVYISDLSHHLFYLKFCKIAHYRIIQLKFLAAKAVQKVTPLLSALNFANHTFKNDIQSNKDKNVSRKLKGC